MSKYLLIQADARHLPLADKSVQMCVTSPPYYGLRDYGTAKWEGGDPMCDHAAAKKKTRWDYGFSEACKKQATNVGTDVPQYDHECPCGARRVDQQLGLEQTPAEYVDNLVAVFREVRRVLKDDGVAWLNLGDSYAGGGGYSPNSPSNQGGSKQSSNRGSKVGVSVPPGVKAKDLVGIPWSVAFALRDDGWYLRSDIIWHKPNPMPSSVRDRPTTAHEYLFLLTKSGRYFYDSDAIREPFADDRMGRDGSKRNSERNRGGRADGYTKPNGIDPSANGGKNKRSVWTITPRPFKGAHFATFPPALVEPCVLAGSRTGDTVLDPFNGAGTSGVVAVKHGRNYVGTDLNPEYLQMSRKRIADSMPTAAEASDQMELFAEIGGVA